MKRISKLFAVTAALIIMLTALAAFPASAASVRFTASNVSGAKGDTVTINVNVSGDAKIWGTVLELKYNSSQLQYVGYNEGSLMSMGSIHNNGSSVKFAGNLVTDKVKNGGTVFSVKFKILMNSGTSTLALSTLQNYDKDENTVSATASNGSVKVTVPVSGISLNQSSVSLKKGGTSQLTATVAPADATNKTVTYTSSDTKVATVNSSGKITAVGGGTATITAKAGGKSATCKVTVTVPQTGIKVSGSASRTVGLGSTMKLSAQKVPADATDNHSVTWSSADAKTATVSANGTVTGVSLGTTKITAKSNGWTAVYTVTVVEKASETTTESATDETTTLPEESETTEPTTALTTTEPETVETTTEPENEDGFFANIFSDTDKFFKNIRKKIADENNTVTKFYHYAMMLGVFIVTAAISISVTYFITSGYYKNKQNKNQNIER